MRAGDARAAGVFCRQQPKDRRPDIRLSSAEYVTSSFARHEPVTAAARIPTFRCRWDMIAAVVHAREEPWPRVAVPLRGFLTKNEMRASVNDIGHASVPYDAMDSLTAQMRDRAKTTTFQALMRYAGCWMLDAGCWIRMAGFIPRVDA